MTESNWPSREEWAMQSRTCYPDMLPDPSGSIADYATQDEIAALKIALRERWKLLGKRMRDLGKCDLAAHEIWANRKSIHRGLNLIEEGELPIQLDDYSGAKDILSPFHARYHAARDGLWKRKELEVAKTPINDEAWEAELKRRARVDQWLGRVRQRSAGRVRAQGCRGSDNA